MLIGRRYRHLQRLRRIAGVIWRYGFGFLVEQLGIPDLIPFRERVKTPPKKGMHSSSRGSRLRHALMELGPTFIKLGQLLSTRHDLLPGDVVKELQKLQDEVDSFPFADVKSQIENEFGLPLEEVFASFKEEPLASASIGQVHEAVLPTGEEVVVKVRRPAIRRIIETDLEILFDIARLAERRTSWGKIYSFQDMVREFADTLQREMDYSNEGRNTDRMRENLAQEEEKVYIPKVYWEYTTPVVLTMEHVKGIKLSNRSALVKQGINLAEVARALSRSLIKQALVYGFFHADPHPGNVLVLPDGRIVLLDFGMASFISEEQRDYFFGLLFALVRGNSRKIVKIILDMGLAMDDVDQQEMRWEVERLRDKYYNLPLQALRLGDSVTELHRLAYRYKVRFPKDLTVLSKALLTLEGTVAELSPQINLLELIEPLGRKLLRERYSRRQVKKWFGDFLPAYGDILLDIPKRMHSILGRLEKNQFNLKLDFIETERFLRRIERISNRISFSIVLLSFSIIMAGLLISSSIGGAVLFWEGLPILEFGFIAAGIMAFWLFFSIFRSGRF